jgi:hypothetical protein
MLKDLEALARRVGTRIADALPPSVGFVLVLHDFGSRGWLTFVSNTQRKDTLASLAELLGALAPEPSPERRELLGRRLRTILGDRDEEWFDGLSEKTREEWCDKAETFAKTIHALS